MDEQRRASLLAEADYKDQMAEDLKRVGAWQSYLHREAAQRLRAECEAKPPSKQQQRA